MTALPSAAHRIQDVHFPRLPAAVPGHIVCSCATRLEAMPRAASSFEDPWQPLTDAFSAHRREVNAGTAKDYAPDGTPSAWNRDNSRPHHTALGSSSLSARERGLMGAAAKRAKAKK